MLGRWVFGNIFDIVRVCSRFRTAESFVDETDRDHDAAC